MTRILQPGDGEALKLGPPSSGQVIIKVDPKRSGSALVMGTQTLSPGAVIPAHRHLYQDEVWFIHKGQGRVTLEGQAATILPGMSVYIPRQTWHGLRNTGTGLLQWAWIGAPPGVEEFLRELSRAGAPSPEALQELGRRHGIEVAKAGELPSPTAPAAPVPRRGRRRRRGRGTSHRPQVQATAGPPPSAPPATSSRPAPSPAPRLQPPAAPPPRAAQRPRRSHRRRGRVREVYMEGRWIQVTGEGPVISS